MTSEDTLTFMDYTETPSVAPSPATKSPAATSTKPRAKSRRDDGKQPVATREAVFVSSAPIAAENMYCYYSIVPERGVMYRTGETEFSAKNVGADILCNGKVLEVPLNLSEPGVYMIGRSMPAALHQSLVKRNSALPIDPNLGVFYAGPFKIQREHYVFVVVAADLDEAHGLLMEQLKRVAKDFDPNAVSLRSLATSGRFAEVLFDQAKLDALAAVDKRGSDTGSGSSSKRKRFRGDAKTATVYYANMPLELDTSERAQLADDDDDWDDNQAKRRRHV